VLGGSQACACILHILPRGPQAQHHALQVRDLFLAVRSGTLEMLDCASTLIKHLCKLPVRTRCPGVRCEKGYRACLSGQRALIICSVRGSKAFFLNDQQYHFFQRKQ